MKILLRFLTALLFFIGTIVQVNAVEPARSRLDSLITSLSGDDDEELTEILRNMPNIEVGRGISFKPKNESYKLTMRFRMQNMVGVELNKDFTATETEARVKRLRLRFDGYIYSPKLTYSIQLGFTPYDAKVLPNGNMNIVRDAMVYYVPSAVWNVGFGQTKIKANRARTNSSSALQFVDRSIVNSEFNLDRDFGFFGEFNKHLFGHFDLAARASVTLGEGRNWSSSKGSGLAYTGRLELFPLGRFKGLGDVQEGDFAWEEKPKILFAGAYSFNDRALRVQGQNGAMLTGGRTRSLSSYFADFIFKYQGFAFYTDFMGRSCDTPVLYIPSPDEVEPGEPEFIYKGNGVNVQTSYLFRSNWEIALRNSTLLPDESVQSLVGYEYFNQSTIGVTKYLIGHTLKIQADASYNYKKMAADPDYNRWEFRFQVELGF